MTCMFARPESRRDPLEPSGASSDRPVWSAKAVPLSAAVDTEA